MKLFLIFATIGVSFFLLERLFPCREQKIWRKGLVTDCFYVPIHFALRLFVSFFLATELTALGRKILPGQTDLVSDPCAVTYNSNALPKYAHSEILHTKIRAIRNYSAGNNVTTIHDGQSTSRIARKRSEAQKFEIRNLEIRNSPDRP